MKLLDVVWALPVNNLHIECDCGAKLSHPASISLVRCPRCRRIELWHAVDPKPERGPWSETVMQSVFGGEQ